MCVCYLYGFVSRGNDWAAEPDEPCCWSETRHQRQAVAAPLGSHPQVQASIYMRVFLLLPSVEDISVLIGQLIASFLMQSHTPFWVLISLYPIQFFFSNVCSSEITKDDLEMTEQITLWTNGRTRTTGTTSALPISHRSLREVQFCKSKQQSILQEECIGQYTFKFGKWHHSGH